MKHYMRDWRAKRAFAKDDLCECDGGPRVAYDKGCARCEELDRQRYARRSNTDRLRDAVVRYDSVALSDLADRVGLNVEQARYAMRRLIDSGEVAVVGAGNATEYMPKRRAA